MWTTLLAVLQEKNFPTCEKNWDIMKRIVWDPACFVWDKFPITALSEEKPLQGQIWENEQTF